MKTFALILLIGVVLLTSCNVDTKENIQFTDPSFKSLLVEIDPSQSGLQFNNLLDENILKNPFNYINAYNGGGVAIGDVNNDGLQDVYMTGNMVDSRLFLNKGKFKFEDASEKAGIKVSGWSTAPIMADVNQDGWLDIYICRSYHDNKDARRNLLFINNQDGTFSEKGGEYGVDDANYSITASFFDFDLDGDLDLIVGNHPKYRLLPFTQVYDYWQNPIKRYSNRMFRNDEGKFVDVTESAGLLTYGFTLGLVTSDLNDDGYPDIYIAVDHDEPDQVLINAKDGTFLNTTSTAVKQVSRSSMGMDAGDVNHDKYPDLIIAEMLSEDHYREKVNMSMQSVDRFEQLVNTLNLKYYQMRNFLHLNNGNGTFSDIAQMAEVHKTDWSWSALFIDVDNNGWQDIFISNGYYRDVYNQDLYKPFDSVMLTLGNDARTKNRVAAEYARNCPQSKVHNYLFRNNGNLSFDNVSILSGLAKETISTGAAYGDLDNDGDIDIVINNLGEPSSIFENKTSSENNYLRIKFEVNDKIPNLGAKIRIKYGDDEQSREYLTTRGYQSSCEPFVHFGLGEISLVNEVQIIWPDQKMQILNDVEVNQVLSLNYTNATQIYSYDTEEYVTEEIESAGLLFSHQENVYDDYDDQILLPHKMSEQGPFISIADINDDGIEDLFVGGAAGQAAAMYIQENGKFKLTNEALFDKDKLYEDAGSAFFDSDNDGDLDLLIASGGYELEQNSTYYKPRMYLNNGNGTFVKSSSSLPKLNYSSSCVKPIDFDSDGDMDVFIGGRLNPKRYPEPGRSSLLINEGKGVFQDKTKEINIELSGIGMVRDAIWTDLNNDKQPDLIVVGEWMPITVLIQENGKLTNQTDAYFNIPQRGWWNCIRSADLDQNGYEDFIIGNLGYNYKYKASDEKPFQVFAKDIDENGTLDIILGSYYGDIIYPVRGRSCSSEQLPEIKEKFPSYHEYALADIDQVYGSSLDEALHYTVNQFASVILFQEEPGKFTLAELPIECQKSPINGIVVFDVNEDGLSDLIVAGNHYQAEIETGRADAGTGTILINKGNREWRPLEVYESGLYLDKDLKSLELLDINGENAIVAGNNNDKIQLIRILPSRAKKIASFE